MIIFHFCHLGPFQSNCYNENFSGSQSALKAQKKARFLLNRVNMCPKWEKYFWQLKQITLTWPKTIQRGRVLVAKPTSCLKKYFSIFTSFHPIILNITIGWWKVLLEWMTIWWMRECIQSGVRASLGVSQTSFATNRHTLEPWFFTSAAWT